MSVVPGILRDPRGAEELGVNTASAFKMCSRRGGCKLIRGREEIGGKADTNEKDPWSQGE